MIRLTVTYDNRSVVDEAIPSWGFSCLVELDTKTVLFDTGGNYAVLSHNLSRPGIDPKKIDHIFRNSYGNALVETEAGSSIAFEELHGNEHD